MDAVRLTAETAHGEFTLRLKGDELNTFTVVCDHCGNWISFRLTKVQAEEDYAVFDVLEELIK